MYLEEIETKSGGLMPEDLDRVIIDLCKEITRNAELGLDYNVIIYPTNCVEKAAEILKKYDK